MLDMRFETSELRLYLVTQISNRNRFVMLKDKSQISYLNTHI